MPKRWPRSSPACMVLLVVAGAHGVEHGIGRFVALGTAVHGVGLDDGRVRGVVGVPIDAAPAERIADVMGFEDEGLAGCDQALAQICQRLTPEQRSVRTFKEDVVVAVATGVPLVAEKRNKAPPIVDTTQTYPAPCPNSCAVWRIPSWW